MDGPIASAVVLPEELSVTPASPISHNKRRQSSVSEDAAKRPRLDDDATVNDDQSVTKDHKPAAPVRRERGRERRLFGAALGALSQNSATTAQKRRFEIEKRQLAQRKQINEEGEQRKAERVARRKEQRWVEQRRFEKESMRTRHDNLLGMAHFLQTKAEPHLYYKPWETNPEEEDRIQGQIAKAEDIIKREVEEYENRLQQAIQRRRNASEDAGQDAKETQNGKSQDADASQETLATNGGTNGSAHSSEDLDMKDHHPEHPAPKAVSAESATEIAQDSAMTGHETIDDDPSKEHDDGEDVVEEAAEDTVIY